MRPKHVIEAELFAAKEELKEVQKPRALSMEDYEDISDNYQENLEYNYYISDLKSLIEDLTAELAQ